MLERADVSIESTARRHQEKTHQDKRWTAAAVATLTAMWADGASVRAIADALGMSWEQVRSKRSKLGLERRAKGMTTDDKWPEHKKATLRREYRLGTSYGRIAEMVGKRVEQVKAQRVAMGIDARDGIAGKRVALKVYCSEEDARRFGRRAMVHGMSASAYMRRLVLRELQ